MKKDGEEEKCSFCNSVPSYRSFGINDSSFEDLERETVWVECEPTCESCAKIKMIRGEFVTTPIKTKKRTKEGRDNVMKCLLCTHTVDFNHCDTYGVEYLFRCSNPKCKAHQSYGISRTIKGAMKRYMALCEDEIEIAYEELRNKREG